MATLKNKTGSDSEELRAALRKLKDEQKIIVKKGINGHLILLK